MTATELKQTALNCGFDLAGIAPALPLPEFNFFQDWIARGNAADMAYLSGHRGEMRRDPRSLLPSAKSILVCGVLYNAPQPYSTALDDPQRAWISRYAWGDDYHDTLRARFERLTALLPPCEFRICVDTAPLLERAYAQRAGLGWIGKNTCLINQEGGSWFFLGELLLSLTLEPDAPPPDRCGTCARCIEACPTAALVTTGHDSPAWELDSRLCISYHTIESRTATPIELRARFDANIFGCDICQDVCPWNGRAFTTVDPAFQPRTVPRLEDLAQLSEGEFRELFRHSPVERAKYRGFLRNVCTAMANHPQIEFRAPLERLAQYEDAAVREHAAWALERLLCED